MAEEHGEREAHITLYGRVQGVGCRKMIESHAQRLGIRGYAENDPNGTVLVVAQGRDAQLHELIAWLRASPGFSRVERVKTAWHPIETMHEGFEIRKAKAFVPDQAQSMRNLLRSLR